MNVILKKLGTREVHNSLLAAICLNLSVSVKCNAEALLAQDSTDAPASLSCPASYRPQILPPHYENHYDYYEWSQWWTNTGGPSGGSCEQFETQNTLPNGQVETIYNNTLRCLGGSRRYTACYTKKGGTLCTGDAIRVVEDAHTSDLTAVCNAKEFTTPLMEVDRKGKCEAPELIPFVCSSAVENEIEQQANVWIEELYDIYTSRRVRAVCCVPLTLGVPVIGTIDAINLEDTSYSLDDSATE